MPRSKAASERAPRRPFNDTRSKATTMAAGRNGTKMRKQNIMCAVADVNA